jgi:hypothetical protein
MRSLWLPRTGSRLLNGQLLTDNARSSVSSGSGQFCRAQDRMARQQDRKYERGDERRSISIVIQCTSSSRISIRLSRYLRSNEAVVSCGLRGATRWHTGHSPSRGARDCQLRCTYERWNGHDRTQDGRDGSTIRASRSKVTRGLHNEITVRIESGKGSDPGRVIAALTARPPYMGTVESIP